jgi:MFS family permease
MCVVGYLSDKFGRKVVVYVSGSFMAIIPLILIITDNFTIMIVAGLVFGLAYGGYITYRSIPNLLIDCYNCT